MRSLTQRRAALTRPPRVGVVVPGRQVTRTRRPYGSPEPDIARVNPNEESAVSVQVEDADPALVRLLHEQHAGPAYACCVRFTGSVSLQTRSWGTELQLRLDDLPTADGYAAHAVDSRGVRTLAASWGPTPARSAMVPAATALAPSALRRSVNETSDGAAVLSFVA